MTGPPMQDLFAAVAPRYDLLNHALSFGVDRSWRRALVRRLKGSAHGPVLDLATGTGDLALAAVRHAPRIAAVVGLDLAGPMLERARTKAAGDARVTFAQGDARTLPFGDNAFSAVIIAWGIRNFHGHREETLDEIHRVLQPGGLLLILELGLPSVPWLRYAYRSYLRHLLPRLAGIAGADPAAYHYLSRSVEAFPEPDTVNRTIASHGFSTVPPRRLTLGAATLFEARRT